MNISPVKLYSPKSVNFGNTENKQNYENPVNRTTERNLAILSSAGTSMLVGAAAFGLTTCLANGRKIPGIAGILAAGATLALTLPTALYNAKVGSFERKENMDVFSRQKAAQKSIYGEINQEIQKEEVPLENKVDLYAKVAMADNGKGVMVKGA